MKHRLEITDEELHMVIAALRLWQRVQTKPVMIEDIASVCGYLTPLSDDGIDDLVKYINCGER